MKVKTITAPNWTVSPFSKDAQDRKTAKRQYDSYHAFYRRILPKLDGLMWQSNKMYYIFSKDTKSGGYRVSAFDSAGAVSHCRRDTIKDLFHSYKFPFAGQKMTAVTKGGLDNDQEH